jgi:hypothetical protein
MIATFPVRMFFIAIIATVSFFAQSLRAQGYVDPGVGAMLWQILAAAFVGALFLLRRFVSGWFRGGKAPRPGGGAGRTPHSDQ